MRAWPELARLSESLGFDCLWHSNERFYREMWVRMTASAMVTSRMALGGAIAEPFAMHPALTAQALATVAELTEGRATLAMGAGGSGFPMMGIRRHRPAVALREAVAVMRGLLAGETVTLDGRVIRAHNARLQFTPPQPVELWIATRGDRTLQTAGEVADGVIIATYAQPEHVAAALRIVEKGTERAGRKLANMRIMARVDTCVHEDPTVAYDGSRAMVAKLLWASYPDRGFVERAGLRVPDHVEAVIATRDYDALEGIVDRIPDELVTAFCWAGTPTTVVDRVLSIAKRTGIREFGFWVLRAPDQTLAEATVLLAERVIPSIRSALESDHAGA